MPNMGEFEQMPSEHQLWVNLSSASGGNIFGQIPELIKNMLAPEISDDEVPEDEFHFMLASDYEWRINIYMKLLKKMRHDTTSTEMPVPWREEEEVVKMHHWDILPKPSKPKPCCPDGERVTKTENVSFGPNPITWTVGDIAKAARLLSTPPMKTNFEDEQEMRRVYTLIYDTFRYKGILNQALNDIAFYQLYPTFEELTTRVWLLFFDLYHRSFRKREPVSVETAIKLFPECGLTSIDDALWMHRVKLAAAVARLRIKNSALRLSELLPKHLRDERISCQGKNCPVTCWINPHKVKTEEELVNLISKTLKLKLVDKSNLLTVDSFKWDTLCPNFVSFHHSLRSILARSTLVQKHKLIVQDRSFCLGPATFGKVVFDMELAGNVIQSHVNSPRSTAYLATILSLNSRIASLLVFGAGPRKGEYDSYFQDLGMNNVAIYSEKLIDMAPDSNCLDRVIAVFATPPNSYSAVSDPIDLVCSRGGDLSMLEVLTESEVSDDGRGRVQAILEEQRKTLKFAMSRPQIQVVLYETHSELEVENDGMVQKALKDMNKLARLKHAALQGKIRMPSSVSDIASQEIKEINNNDNVKFDMLQSEESLRSSISKRLSIVSKASAESLEGFDKIYKDINVPDCDLFDNSNLPDLCENADCCLKLSEEGCYLALLQRKEVTKLNNKYMIQMAEVRGLFGNESGESGRNKTGRGSKSKKQEKRPASPPTTKTKRKTKHIEFDRIAAPTDSSIRHSHNGIINNEIHKCPRHRNEEEGPLIKVPQSRRWWSETTRHITNLRESLVNQKILPPVKKTASQPNARTITRTLMHATYKIDEIVAKSSENYNIPVFPRLRLTRNTRRAEKIPLPVPVTYVQFRGRKSAMDSLKNAAADVREMAKQWAEYKKINLGDIRKLDALTKGYISPDESSSSSTLEDPDPPPGPPPSNPHPRPRPQTSPAQFPPIPPPDPLPTSRPTLTFKYINPLTLLERLTRSKDLKGVVSSRPPYISKKPHYPAYGWRFFLEKSYITFPTDEQLDVLTPTEANIDISSRNLTPSTPSSRGKSRTRQASPSRPEVLEGVLTNPTHTRNTVHMAKINVGGRVR